MNPAHATTYANRNAITVAEFCQRNCISRATFYNEVSRGNVSYFKVGSKTLVSLAAERAWLAKLDPRSAGGDLASAFA